MKHIASLVVFGFLFSSFLQAENREIERLKFIDGVVKSLKNLPTGENLSTDFAVETRNFENVKEVATLIVKIKDQKYTFHSLNLRRLSVYDERARPEEIIGIRAYYGERSEWDSAYEGHVDFILLHDGTGNLVSAKLRRYVASSFRLLGPTYTLQSETEIKGKD
jgi:hypothetical protein